MKIKDIREDKNFRGHAAIFTAQLIFGANMVIGKKALASPYVTPDALTFYRMVGASVLFWIFSLFGPREKVARKDLFMLFFASLFGIMLNQYFFIHGLALTSPINASMISTLGPIITMIIAALYLHEPITFQKAGGVALGMAGAFILIFAGRGGGSLDGNLKGDLLCLLSCLSFAIYLTFFRDLVRRYSSVTVMKWMFLYAALCSLPFSYESLSPQIWRAMPWDILASVLYVVVFATFIAYLLLPVGQRYLRPTVVSMYNNLQPLVASIISVAIGIASFGWIKGLAAALIFAGVYITTTSKSRAQLEAAGAATKGKNRTKGGKV